MRVDEPARVRNLIDWKANHCSNLFHSVKLKKGHRIVSSGHSLLRRQGAVGQQRKVLHWYQIAESAQPTASQC